MKSKKLVLGTKNNDKLRELKRLLRGTSVEILSLQDYPKCADVAENGKTFDANAKKKARAYSLHTKMLTIADDSGLMVNCLNGKPGVYSARFAGPGCNYQDNNLKLLKLLENKPAGKRKAKFVSVIAIYNQGKLVQTVKGTCYGAIARRAKGVHGFGYDPVFVPRGFNKTYAELKPSEKNKISHRGKALGAAIRVILRYMKLK